MAKCNVFKPAGQRKENDFFFFFFQENSAHFLFSLQNDANRQFNLYTRSKFKLMKQ